jgi:hypothetical protein
MDAALARAVPQLHDTARDRLSAVNDGNGDDPARVRRIRRLAFGLAAVSVVIYFVYYLAGYLLR